MLGEKGLKVLMIGLLSVLFVLAVYTTQAVAFMSDGGTPFSYMGTIVNVNPSDKIVTVQESANGELSFNLNDNTEVMRCGQTASIRDLKAGDNVTLGYYDQSDGVNIVSWIELKGASC